MIKTILVPLDGSETAERALPHAAALALFFDARLLLARVPETRVMPVMVGEMWATEEVESEDSQQHAEAYLEQVAVRPEFEAIEVTTVTPGHPVTEGLIQTIEDESVDLIVMTTHGYSGFQRFVFGSVADKLVHIAPAPIYLVRETEDHVLEPVFRRIMVPLDGSELAEQALETAKHLSHATGAAITLMQVPTVPSYITGIPETAGWIPKYLAERAAEATAYLQDVAARLADDGLEVDIDVEVVTAGSVADGILSAAVEHDVNVIVMCTHGRTGLGRWVFGSVADKVLRGADRPVWLTRARHGDA